MQRSSVVTGLLAAVLIASAAWADDTQAPAAPTVPAPPTQPAPSQGAAPQSAPEAPPQPASPQPASPQTLAPQPVQPQNPVTQPSAAQPSATQPPATQPPATQPAATQPPAPQPPAPQPAATQPAAAQPSAPQPPATQPSAPQRPATQPPAPQAAPAQTAVQSVAPEYAEAILGQRVTDSAGKEIGRLVDVLVDANGQPQAAVIDFGGFMGVGNRKIAVHWSALRFTPGDAKRKVAVEMTPDQIKDAPEFRNPNKAASVVTPADASPQPPAPSSP